MSPVLLLYGGRDKNIQRGNAALATYSFNSRKRRRRRGEKKRECTYGTCAFSIPNEEQRNEDSFGTRFPLHPLRCIYTVRTGKEENPLFWCCCRLGVTSALATPHSICFKRETASERRSNGMKRTRLFASYSSFVSALLDFFKF